MSRKQKLGKQVYNKFFAREHYTTEAYYEEQIKVTVDYLKRAWWLYTNREIGEVKVFRNKIGARVIAYDLPQKYN